MTDLIKIATNLPCVTAMLLQSEVPVEGKLNLGGYMPPQLLELLQKVRAKNFKYSFVVEKHAKYVALGEGQLSRVDVLFDGEVTGSVRLGRSYSSGSGYAFFFSNTRMSNARQRRGSDPYTSKVSVAVKHILTHYTAKTAHERMAGFGTATGNALGGKQFKTPYHLISYSETENLLRYIADRPEVYADMRASGVCLPEDLDGAFERSAMARVLSAHKNTNTLIYAQRNPETGSIAAYTHELGAPTYSPATPEIVSACAMLRLSPGPITWLGLQLEGDNENVFVILPEGLERLREEMGDT